MKLSFRIALMLVCGTACEIEDDFGKPALRAKPGEKIASSPPYVTKMTWYQDDKVLLLWGSLAVLDLSQRIIEPISDELFIDVAGVTNNAKAIAMSRPNETTLAIRSVDMTNGHAVTLSSNAFYDQGYSTFAVISGDDVFFSEIDEDGRVVMYRHNIVADHKSELFENGVPLAISPDRTKLLYGTLDDRGIIYDLQQDIHIPTTLFTWEFVQSVWIESGLLLYSVVYDQTIGGVLRVENLTTNKRVVEHEGVINGQSVFVSQDGQRYAYSTAHCSNEYYVYDCYHQRSLIGIIERSLGSEAGSEVARHDTPDAPLCGAISPDGSALVYALVDGVFYVSLTE